jgi:drug/metabolite transporter (DMT)-like permease
MPLWTALGAHFLLPGEHLTRVKAAGLALAFTGVAWAIAHRPAGGGEGSLLGDLFALLGAVSWAALALIVRATPIAKVRPETQLLWQLAVSAPLLLLAAPLFGPLIRELQPIHLAGLAFQTLVIASGAFLFWLWLMTRYPATSVVSFGFLSPIFGALFGWALMGEQVGLPLWTALALVAAGLYLINRPAAQVPQKVCRTS